MLFPVLADTSHASPEAAAFFDSYFTAKSEHALEAFLSHFDPDCTYVDATLGWYLADLDALRATLAGAMPSWGDGISYATRILGDEHSGIIAVTDTPELFGNEIRSLSPYDMSDNKITRFVDYWDARHFGVEAADRMRTPDEQFPTVLGEDTVKDTGGAGMHAAVARLTEAFSACDAERAAAAFSPDAVLEDLTLHCQFVGRLAIARFLSSAVTQLPYAGDVHVCRVLGGGTGGGFEWRAGTGRPVRSGVTALELDDAGLVTRFTAVWDGSRLDDASIHRLSLAGAGA